MSTGLDGGLDGGTAVAAVAPSPPPPPTQVSAFAALVAQMDRAAKANLGAVPVLYVPAAGGGIIIDGIFDAQYLLAKGSPEAGVETLGPAVFFQIADIPADPEADDPTLTINGVAYYVDERKPDDMGGIVLYLRKVRP